MQIAMIIGAIVLVISCGIVFCAVFNDCLPKLFCDKFGWHVKPKDIKSDGCSMTGKCSRCGKDTMQDSQGNWF